MTQRNHAESGVSAIESKFYLAAGLTPPFDSSRVERIWASLFSHCVEPPN
jgi:hypothetical protein